MNNHLEKGRIKHFFHCLNNQRRPLSGAERVKRQGQYPYYGASGVIDHIDAYLFDEETILIAEDGANLISRNLPLAIRASGQYWVNNHAHILRPRDAAFSFWTHKLESMDFFSYVTGSAQPKLTKENLLNITVEVPTYPRRLEIAAFLDRKTRAIDALIQKRRQLIKRLDEQRVTLINHVITEGLTHSDDRHTWPVQRLKHLAQFNPSKSEVRHLPDDLAVSFLPMEDISAQRHITHKTTKPIGELYSSYTYFRQGDVLIAKITPCFENGKGAIADELSNGIGFGTTELHVIRTGPKLHNRYLNYLTMSHAFMVQGTAMMTGAAGQKRLPEDFITSYTIALPPLDTQRQIATVLDHKTRTIDTLIHKQQQLIEKLQEYRRALITTTVTGKINPE